MLQKIRILRADVSYFLCCIGNKANRRRLHAGKKIRLPLLLFINAVSVCFFIQLRWPNNKNLRRILSFFQGNTGFPLFPRAGLVWFRWVVPGFRQRIIWRLSDPLHSPNPPTAAIVSYCLNIPTSNRSVGKKVSTANGALLDCCGPRAHPPALANS